MASARDRLGPVGVWSERLGEVGAAEERAAVAELEGLGYGAIWLGESSLNKEAYAHVGIVLAATKRIVVATGIANIYARDPVAMATGAEAIGDAYPGRFLLGLGISHAPLVSARGHDYGPPLATMRAYLDAVDSVSYNPPAAEPSVPRVLGALGPRMIALARDRASGVHPYFVPVAHTSRARELLGPEALLAPEQAVLLERDPDRAREVARAHTSVYLGLPNYVRMLHELGYDDEDLAGSGSDRLIDDIVAWGCPDEIRARVDAQLAAGADHVAVQALAGDVPAALRQLRELAPALLTGR